MFKIFCKTYIILSPRERLQGIVVTGMMVMQALAEVSGIVSITPFLAVLGNPNVVRTSKYLAPVYNAFGFTSAQHFMVALGIAAFLVLAGTSIFRAIVQYAKARFVNMRRHTVSSRLLERYIGQPYVFFLQSNSGQLTAAILSEVDQFIMNGLSAWMQFFSYAFVIIAIVILLLAVSVQLASIVAGTLGLVYVLIYWRLSRGMIHLGQERKKSNAARYQITSEILGGVKELKVLGREQVYLDTFQWPSLRFARAQTGYQLLSETPRYLVEIIGFCALLLIVVYMTRAQHDLGHALPVIGLYAFAAYRLLPAAQNIYGALTTLQFNAPATEAVYKDLVLTPPPVHPARAREKMPLRQAIELRGVSFRYAGAAKPALSDLNFTIPALQSTGIVGATGAGKSTLVDLILGILSPTAGEILIDGIVLTPEKLGAWQNSIGYVPQQIFLADDTAARNIAFGIAEKEIDRAAVENAARLAQIDEFIARDLPHGYDTLIGERGIRLSGGQRQRIGIARALYHNPDVLILDEATSALDSETEAEVMQAIENLAGRKTIIMIAHRRNTLRSCTALITLADGAARIDMTADSSKKRSNHDR